MKYTIYKWWKYILVFASLSILGFVAFENYVTCDYGSCSDVTPIENENSDSLSDLNGVEICLSLKFVESIHPLKVTTSPQSGTNSSYAVVYNYLKSSRFYGVNETVTYTTHSTPEFLDNIGQIAERWEGPISVALYVPFTDFCRAIHRVIYLRNCESAAYREKVTWHLYWPTVSPPPTNWQKVPDETNVDCDKLAIDYKHNEDLRVSWRRKLQHPYPVNVARNIARVASTTWFVLPSDVELYPSPGLATQFINYITIAQHENVKAFVSPSNSAKSKSSHPVVGRKVYVVPVFEVEKDVPNTKEELMIQYTRRTAVYFHKLVCPHCQKFPDLRNWVSNRGTPGEIHGMSWSFRHFPFHRWEPIYICSKDEPLYEESLSWEGLQDKMTQMYELCLRNYKFVLLDRAFLVHHPGIKRRLKGQPSYAPWRSPFISRNGHIHDSVMHRLDKQFGSNPKCLNKH